MKKSIITTYLLLLSIGTYAQQDGKPIQSGEDFSYVVKGLVYFYEYDVENREKTDIQRIPEEGLKFNVVREEIDEIENSTFEIVKILPIQSDSFTKDGVPFDLTNSVIKINSGDNEKYFWISKEELNRLVADNYVEIKYETYKFKWDYGASVSIPFKYRTKTDDQNIKITPDLTLGGYLGLRTRINSNENFYFTLPLTLGLTTLSVNDNTKNSNSTTDGDGLVLGITASTGIVFELNDFQFGLIAGIDRAGGELGKEWIYNDKVWYSFSIGYSFLGRKNK